MVAKHQELDEVIVHLIGIEEGGGTRGSQAMGGDVGRKKAEVGPGKGYSGAVQSLGDIIWFNFLCHAPCVQTLAGGMDGGAPCDRR